MPLPYCGESEMPPSGTTVQRIWLKRSTLALGVAVPGGLSLGTVHWSSTPRAKQRTMSWGA